MQASPETVLKQLFTEPARFQRWLDVEASLARAQASLGIIPKEAAEEITRAARVELLDLSRYDELFRQVRHPIVALLRLWQPIIRNGAGQYVHLGATTQDAIDTGTILAMKETHAVAYESLRRMESDLLDLAEKHADTVMVGRTHGVQAVPITFGYKVAIWAREIRRNIQRLKECKERIFVLQLSGAVGTMAAFGPKGPLVHALVAKDLGLAQADISWHASRDRYAEFANLLALIGGCLGRIGQEVYRLMATEVGEVREPWEMGNVGSSTMPHKVNPEMSQNMISLSKKLRYNAAFITEVMVVDHERNLEHFLGEREKMEESCLILGELLALGEEMANNLTVYPERMKANVSLLKGLLLAEAVMIDLGRKIGKQTAHEVVYEDAMRSIGEGIEFKQALLQDERISTHLSEVEIDRLLDPVAYIGLAPQITRDAVALSRSERGEDSI